MDTIQQALVSAMVWCEGSGAAGIAGFALLYCLSSLVVFPAAILTAAAGWAWGFVWGNVIVLAVSLVADLIPFLLARRLGRARVAAAAKRARTLAALDAAMRSRGFLLVMLLRLSPIAPYNVMNYLLGLTPVSVRTYLTASTIGCLPSCFFFVYLGTLVPRASQLGKVRLFDHPVALIASVGALLLAMGVFMLVARRALRQIIPASE